MTIHSTCDQKCEGEPTDAATSPSPAANLTEPRLAKPHNQGSSENLHHKDQDSLPATMATIDDLSSTATRPSDVTRVEGRCQSTESEAIASHPPPWYYQAAIGLLKPIYRLVVWRRSHHLDHYKHEVAARFGHQYPPRPAWAPRGVIWCHAVSLGETNTVAPLLDQLLEAGFGIWLTNTTQTGFARGASRFQQQIAEGRVSHSFVPVDSKAVISRFLSHVRPVAALFMETELWATMLAQLRSQSIPAVLVNARLSETSFRRYRKMAQLSRSMMANLSLIIAQDAATAKRFRKLGATSANIRVAGSLKWVATPHQMLAAESQIGAFAKEEKLASIRPVWILASSHAGEEAIALAVHQQLITTAGEWSDLADALLIIVPRHPERFAEVAEAVSRSGLVMAQRSLGEAITTQTQVFLADTMGELMDWYRLADVAVVGGSLVDIGGHNPIEALTVKTPVIMGPFTQSCQQIVDTLIVAGALWQLPKFSSRQDMQDSLLSQLLYWLTTPKAAQQAGESGFGEVVSHQQVLRRQLSMIESVINQ